jgi:hypothetical protein
MYQLLFALVFKRNYSFFRKKKQTRTCRFPGVDYIFYVNWNQIVFIKFEIPFRERVSSRPQIFKINIQNRQKVKR